MIELRGMRIPFVHKRFLTVCVKCCVDEGSRLLEVLAEVKGEAVGGRHAEVFDAEAPVVLGRGVYVVAGILTRRLLRRVQHVRHAQRTQLLRAQRRVPETQQCKL